jgi:hypothetical protein
MLFKRFAPRRRSAPAGDCLRALGRAIGWAMSLAEATLKN